MNGVLTHREQLSSCFTLNNDLKKERLHSDNACELLGMKKNLEKCKVLTTCKTYGPQSNRIAKLMECAVLRRIEAMLKDVIRPWR